MVDGATPLFITAQNGHNELLKFLLKKGAEVDIKRKVSAWTDPGFLERRCKCIRWGGQFADLPHFS